jgi:beta-phosphoglucomutase-like phosphatase (HAD superfamily)
VDASIPLTAVIFDMDGVLIDSEPIHFEATRALLADHGVEYSADFDDNFYGCTDRDVFRLLRARYRLAPAEEELAASWIARVVALLGRPLQPMAGVPDVLRDLRASSRAGLLVCAGDHPSDADRSRPIRAVRIGRLGP